MKKIFLTSVICALLSVHCSANAADSAEPVSEWMLNIRRIGVDWSRTDVTNAAAYADSPIAQLKADSQDFFKGVFDTALEYRHDKISWDNSLYAEYGRTALKPYNKPETVSENTDKILLTTDLDYALWQFDGFKFGPTARGTYDTEFTANGNVPRRNQLRGGAGLALYDHPIIKDLYIIGLYEYDFTYSNDKIGKSGAEAGWRIEYKIRDGVKASTNGYYRDYFSWSSYLGSDLEWDLLAVARLDSNLWGDFTMGPYVQYRRAKSREADVVASNFQVGVSFNYITSFGL